MQIKIDVYAMPCFIKFDFLMNLVEKLIFMNHKTNLPSQKQSYKLALNTFRVEALDWHFRLNHMGARIVQG